MTYSNSPLAILSGSVSEVHLSPSSLPSLPFTTYLYSLLLGPLLYWFPTGAKTPMKKSSWNLKGSFLVKKDQLKKGMFLMREHTEMILCNKCLFNCSHQQICICTRSELDSNRQPAVPWMNALTTEPLSPQTGLASKIRWDLAFSRLYGHPLLRIFVFYLDVALGDKSNEFD